MQKSSLRRCVGLLVMVGLIFPGCAPPQSSGPDPLLNFAPTLEKRLISLKQAQPPNLDNSLKTITGDISFASGDELSEEEKRNLEEIAGKVVMTTEEFLQQPEQGVIVKITVFGYTDQMDYILGGETEKKLLENVEGDIPSGGDKRRQLLNQLMSERRANIVYEHIEQRLATIKQDEIRIQIEAQIEGRGEELPPGVLPPYPTNDPRRQICKVWVEFTSYAIEE